MRTDGYGRTWLTAALGLALLTACGTEKKDAPAKPTGEACSSDQAQTRCVEAKLQTCTAGVWTDTTDCSAQGQLCVFEAGASRCKAPVPACTFRPTELVAQQSTTDSVAETFIYSARSNNTAQFDVLQIELRQAAPFLGPTGPGEYDLAGSDYATCGVCVTIATDCDANLNCAKSYLANFGKLTIDFLSDNAFNATLTNTSFPEVTLNAEQHTATPVEGGGRLCFQNVVIDHVWGVDTAQCVAAGTGKQLGDNIADFSLKNCLGETHQLHALCGQVKAVWFMFTAGWCSACAERVPPAAAWAAEHAASGLSFWLVLGEDTNGESGPDALTEEYCASYAAQHHVAPENVFIDPKYQTVLSNMHTGIPQDIGLVLPFSMVLRGANMTYTFSEASLGDPQAAVETLLAE